MLALLYLELILLKLQKAKRRNDTTALVMTFLRLLVTIVIRKTTTSRIIPSQKTYYSLENLHVIDY